MLKISCGDTTLLDCKRPISKWVSIYIFCTEQNIWRATAIVWSRHSGTCWSSTFYLNTSFCIYTTAREQDKRELTIQILYMTPTRSQNNFLVEENQRGIWNVLLLGLHMVFYSVNEKLDCFTVTNTGSNGNPELQKFSFNELSKLIMFP